MWGYSNCQKNVKDYCAPAGVIAESVVEEFVLEDVSGVGLEVSDAGGTMVGSEVVIVSAETGTGVSEG